MMNGPSANAGKVTTRTIPTSRATPFSAGNSRPRLPGEVMAMESETFRKTASEEPLGADDQRREQGDVEHRLRPRGAEWKLQQALPHPQQHRGDRGARDTAEATDHDDRHQRADPVPVQGG